MNTRLIVPAILSAVMLTAPVLAAGPVVSDTPSHGTEKAAAMSVEKCASLEQQFDAAIKMHEKAAKANEAKAMRTEGGNLCANGEHAQGIAKLEQALKDLGVKVKS